MALRLGRLGSVGRGWLGWLVIATYFFWTSNGEFDGHGETVKTTARRLIFFILTRRSARTETSPLVKMSRHDDQSTALSACICPFSHLAVSRSGMTGHEKR